MKRLLTIATMVACLSITARGQKSIINGYVVQLNGDTTKGYIAYKNWNKNPSSINFYKQKLDEKQVFDVLNIKAFGVNNGKYADDYVAQTLDIENSVQNLDRLSEDPNPVLVRKTVFLQKILTGEISLLKYTDSTDRSHYFIKKNNRYEELIYKKYYAKSRQIAYNESFKNQLAKIFEDCTSIATGEVERINYREQELTAMISRYNSCKSPNAVSIVRNTQNAPINFGVVGGVSYSSLNLSYLNNINFKASTDFTAGISMLATLPRTAEKAGIYIDLLYRHFKFNEDYLTTISSNQYTTDHFNFEGSYVKLNLLFRYTFAQSKAKPFINIGVSNAIALSDVDRSTRTNVFYTTNETVPQKLFDKVRKHEQGLVMGIGTTFNKIGIELRGETANGFSSVSTVKTAINTGYLLVHYQF